MYKSTSKNDAIQGGKVKFNNGFYYYHISIPKNTKAVAKVTHKNELQVYFEEGKKGYLTFKNGQRENWELYQLTTTLTDTGQYVTYDGNLMKVTNGNQALLKIKKSLKNVNDKKRRRLKGVKVN